MHDAPLEGAPVFSRLVALGGQMTDAVSDQSFRQSTGVALGLTDLLSGLTNSSMGKNMVLDMGQSTVPDMGKYTWKTYVSRSLPWIVMVLIGGGDFFSLRPPFTFSTLALGYT